MKKTTLAVCAHLLAGPLCAAEGDGQWYLAYLNMS
jgi:hypothetical protein